MSNDVMSEKTIGELRSTAKSLGISASKEWTKEDFISAINSRRQNKTLAKVIEDLDEPLEEGYARIKIQNQPGFNGPVDVSINGKFRCSIPRDTWVDVPIEVVDGPLNNSVDYETRPIEPGESRSRRLAVKSYPWIELRRIPTKNGKSILKGSNSPETQAIRNQYRSIFGRWPNTKQDRDARDKLMELKHRALFSPETLTPEQRIILGTN